MPGIQAHTHTHTLTHTLIHTLTRTLTHTQTCTHIRHTHTRTHIHARTHARWSVHVRMLHLGVRTGDLDVAVGHDQHRELDVTHVLILCTRTQ